MTLQLSPDVAVAWLTEAAFRVAYVNRLRSGPVTQDPVELGLLPAFRSEFAYPAEHLPVPGENLVPNRTAPALIL